MGNRERQDPEAEGEAGSPLAPWEDPALFCHDLSSRPKPGLGTVLVTGASGYIGGRLVPELIARGYKVRVMVRGPSPEYEKWWPQAEVVACDVLHKEPLASSLDGIHTAYYLIHSLVRGPALFEAADHQAAANFKEAADKQGVKRIIYLGGLGSAEETLSHHLKSRLEVAEELGRGTVPVTILRAAVIIGSGSASYEIIQHLVRNLPVIFIPKWARNRCQPISIRDVIKYLVGVLEVPETAGRAFDIGGRDILTYENMMRTLSEILQKKTLYIKSPVSKLGLYAYLASLFTPVPAPITLCLMEGLKNDVVCQDEAIKTFLPFETISYREALVRAMSREEQDMVATRWSDAYPPAHELAMKLDELKEKPRFISTFSRLTQKEAPSIFQAFCRLGGSDGWFHGTWMWKLRGAVDRLLMGVGSARGRRCRLGLKVNDVIDFWRVEDLRENERLLLRAEMKLPGRAWLEFLIREEGDKNRMTVTAYYETRRILGYLYWYLLLPFHHYLFKNLLRRIEERC
jgi:uncharacterized protein YbjT (DUF2867 family)